MAVGVRGHGEGGGGVKSRGGEMGRNKFHKKLLYATRWQDDQFKG